MVYMKWSEHTMAIASLLRAQDHIVVPELKIIFLWLENGNIYLQFQVDKSPSEESFDNIIDIVAEMNADYEDLDKIHYQIEENPPENRKGLVAFTPTG